jgi:hypothetical protein
LAGIIFRKRRFYIYANEVDPPWERPVKGPAKREEIPVNNIFF